MSNTTLQFLAVYGPAVPLRDVCDVYFGLTYKEACRKAAAGALPVPTFRLRDSERSPVLIRAEVMAEFVDKTSEAAEAEWLHAQP